VVAIKDKPSKLGLPNFVWSFKIIGASSFIILKGVGQMLRSQVQGQEKLCGRDKGQTVEARITKLCLVIWYQIGKLP